MSNPGVKKENVVDKIRIVCGDHYLLTCSKKKKIRGNPQCAQQGATLLIYLLNI